MTEPFGSTTTQDAPGRRALLIDDEPGVRHVVRRWLESDGYTVSEATLGEDGLRLIQEYSLSFELVLTDLNLPDLSGWDIIHVLAEHRPDVPVLALSSVDSDREEKPEPKVRVISKPFTGAQLLALVRETMEASAALGIRAERATSEARGLRAEAEQANSTKADLVAAARTIRTRRLGLQAGGGGSSADQVSEHHPVCPACGSQRIASIVYGLPSEKAKADYAAGRAVLGGMRELHTSPHWHCRDCEHRWGSLREGS
ncbi:MAG TPA: response regulator [Gemmatimonadales bacterium]|jgi:DNA-binding response OmpR family regulator